MDDGKPSMDITKCFPLLVCQEIFENLSAEDLKTASEVNYDWYKIIAESPKCMEKLKLSFRYSRELMLLWMREIFVNSIRRYQHITCEGSQVDGPFGDLFKKDEGNWKTAQFNYCQFTSEEILLAIMNSLEPTVEELKLVDTHVFVDSRLRETISLNLDRQVTFSKLKKLHCFKSPRNILQKLFLPTTHLEELLFGTNFHDDVSWAELQVLQRMLKANPNLKKLKIQAKGLERVFNDDLWRDVRFKLQDLDISRFANRDQDQLPFMTHFLETQLSSLLHLEICAGLGVAALELIFRMPKLKTLKIPLYDGSAWLLPWTAMTLPKTNLISTLQLDDMSSQEEILKVFVRSLPNLTHLKFSVIEDDTFNFLVNTVPNLESLKTGLFLAELDTVLSGDAFPKMQEFEAQGFTNSIEAFDWSSVPQEGSFNSLIAKAVAKHKQRKK